MHKHIDTLHSVTLTTTPHIRKLNNDVSWFSPLTGLCWPRLVGENGYSVPRPPGPRRVSQNGECADAAGGLSQPVPGARGRDFASLGQMFQLAVDIAVTEVRSNCKLPDRAAPAIRVAPEGVPEGLGGPLQSDPGESGSRASRAPPVSCSVL